MLRVIAVAVVLLGAGTPAAQNPSDSTHTPTGGPPMWTLKSTSFDAGAKIPQRHTGDGDDESPQLAWSAPPAGTKQLALIVDDPDAPSAEPWVHWVLYGIPAAQKDLPAAIPPARTVANLPGLLQGKNSWGSIGWRGPSPPRGHGVHHYHFKLYAVDTPLTDKAGLEKRQLLEAMKGHIVGEVELVGTYQR